MSAVELVGIVNVTPDSFSDGGRSFLPEDAVQSISGQHKAGAAVVDIGAESTRPGATALSWQEEWVRLEPVFRLIGDQKPCLLSLDSRHPQTVERALAYGIDWINDVSGFEDEAMVRLAAQSECRLVVMHSMGVPASKERVFAADADVVAEVLEFGRRRLEKLQQAGVRKERIIFDVGVGFGKTPAQSVRLLRSMARFSELGVDLLVGHSRKSFLPEWGIKNNDKDAATLDISKFLMGQGVKYLRVHDVAGHRELVK